METRKQFHNLARIMIFKVVTLSIRLGSLMICTHNLTILTKTKEDDPLLRIEYVRWQNCSQHTFLSI
jgi:hypothetical protein